jgi:HEPN domain-containing protein
VNRADFQKLSNERIVDAKALLKGKRWSAAYYLAGYAVECGLKSCILRRLTSEAGLIFEKSNKKFSEQCWTHTIENLVKLAGLEGERQTDTAAQRDLGQNWLIVKDWSENSRYQNVSNAKAKKLCEAITNKTNGVMQWIKARW